MRAQATQPLAHFMDMTSYRFSLLLSTSSYEFMIDNVILILKMALTHPSLSLKELEEICNPLGPLPDPIMRSIASFENSPKGFQDLFHVVLVELPVGPYFCRYLDDQTENHMLHVALRRAFDRRARSWCRVCWKRARSR